MLALRYLLLSQHFQTRSFIYKSSFCLLVSLQICTNFYSSFIMLLNQNYDFSSSFTISLLSLRQGQMYSTNSQDAQILLKLIYQCHFSSSCINYRYQWKKQSLDSGLCKFLHYLSKSFNLLAYTVLKLSFFSIFFIFFISSYFSTYPYFLSGTSRKQKNFFTIFAASSLYSLQSINYATIHAVRQARLEISTLNLIAPSGAVVEGDAVDCQLVVALQSLEGLPLGNAPDLDGAVAAGSDEVVRVRVEVGVPHPLRVAYQGLPQLALLPDTEHSGGLVGTAGGVKSIVRAQSPAHQVIPVGFQRLARDEGGVLGPQDGEVALRLRRNQELVVTRDRQAGDCLFKLHRLPFLISLQIEAPQHARLVPGIQLGLAVAKDHGVHWASHPEQLGDARLAGVEDPDGAVLAAAEKPLAVLLEADAHDIAVEALEAGLDRDAALVEVVQFDAGGQCSSEL